MKSEKPPKEPLDIVNDAVRDYKIDSLYVGFSGGKDSAVVAHHASKMFPHLFKGCIFCDTGISVKESKSFVIDYCREMGWKLFVVHPKRTFETIVKEDGFPGPTVHTFIMRYLKYIPMRGFIQKVRETGKRPAILSGVRQQESVRRGINATSEVYQDGKMIFISPMLYKSDTWMYQYYLEQGLKRSPVYDTLHISGDCLCGCFSKPGEAKLVELFHPETAAQIKALEKWRKSRGLRRSTWGKQAGMTHASEQDGIDKFLCNDCILTADDNSDDFLKELDKVEAKLKNV
jgi:3'-phosphoadenosine 5'-phosphosulfate sulfotransferase (PAPS reductase)/FAD synthetase